MLPSHHNMCCRIALYNKPLTKPRKVVWKAMANYHIKPIAWKTGTQTPSSPNLENGDGILYFNLLHFFIASKNSLRWTVWWSVCGPTSRHSAQTASHCFSCSWTPAPDSLRLSPAASAPPPAGELHGTSPRRPSASCSLSHPHPGKTLNGIFASTNEREGLSLVVPNNEISHYGAHELDKFHDLQKLTYISLDRKPAKSLL